MTRNDKILIAVLKGYTLLQVGSVFNISANRVRQIARQTVKKHDSNLWNEGIKELRKHKNRLITTIANSLKFDGIKNEIKNDMEEWRN